MERGINEYGQRGNGAIIMTKGRLEKSVIVCLVSLSAVSASSTRAAASAIDMNPRWDGGQALRIVASSDSGQAEVLIPESSGVWIGEDWFYSLSRPLSIQSSEGLVLGRLERLVLVVSGSPQVSLNFLVKAGASDTQFLIESELLSFTTIASATGRASAGITVTDLDGDGVHLQGAFGDSTRAYQSRINPGPGEMTFAELVENVVLGPGGSITSHGIFPSPVGVFSATSQAGLPLHSADSMQSAFEFTLSANDVAGGTSVFALTIPEPSVGVFAAFVGVSWLLLRRPERHRP
ncbi:MAG: hypothetical protein DCC65_07550 [Planctomycetota bacterium]|nr:MAG: hypothetical protein DCC65_07550 [Planctomycetota bacterium]